MKGIGGRGAMSELGYGERCSMCTKDRARRSAELKTPIDNYFIIIIEGPRWIHPWI